MRIVVLWKITGFVIISFRGVTAFQIPAIHSLPTGSCVLRNKDLLHCNDSRCHSILIHYRNRMNRVTQLFYSQDEHENTSLPWENSTDNRKIVSLNERDRKEDVGSYSIRRELEMLSKKSLITVLIRFRISCSFEPSTYSRSELIPLILEYVDPEDIEKVLNERYDIKKGYTKSQKKDRVGRVRQQGSMNQVSKRELSGQTFCTEDPVRRGGVTKSTKNNSKRQVQRKRHARRLRNNPPYFTNRILPAAKTGRRSVRTLRSGMVGVGKIAHNVEGAIGRKFVEMDGFMDSFRRNDGENDTGDGITEVDWYYANQDNGVHSTKDRVESNKKKRETRARKWKRQGQYNTRIRIRREDKNMTNSKKDAKPQPRLALSLPPVTKDVTFFPSFDDIEPSNEQSLNSKKKQEGEQKSSSGPEIQFQNRTRVPMDEDKKIYAVHGQDEDKYLLELEELYGKAAAKAINTVGDFVADVAEGTYWNATLTDDNVEAFLETRMPYTSDSNRERQRYWRDRLTQKVDNALGLNDDEKSYREWEERYLEIENQQKSNDPVSIFYGKGKIRPNVRNRIPFWEEDGTLMSLLFGRAPQGPKIGSLKKYVGVNTCTSIFSMSFRYAVAIITFLCRWASCRGALPQPFVIFFLAASGVSAPRRRRLVTLGLTLLALRTFAEVLHGYIHGSDGWDDESLFERHQTHFEQEDHDEKE